MRTVEWKTHSKFRSQGIDVDHDRTSASLATCQICLILLLSVMYLFVFGE